MQPVNSSLNDMFEVVAAAFLQILTEFSGVESEKTK
jgi:hypothetical protein